jgi:hypothetical protein
VLLEQFLDVKADVGFATNSKRADTFSGHQVSHAELPTDHGVKSIGSWQTLDRRSALENELDRRYKTRRAAA